MNLFDKKYQQVIGQIMEEGAEEENVRTGHKTRSLPGITFELWPAKDGFPLLTLRKIPIRVFVSEQLWFLTGSRRPSEFLSRFTRIWDDFTNIDGVVTVAYGYRWRQHFGRDQIRGLVAHLEEDPSSRHGVIVAWDPAADGLGSSKRKNIPCPYTFTVCIIKGELHLHNIIRSNDMILGFPHDAAGFVLLQYLLASRLGCRVGKYTHSISNAHIYDIHYGVANELTKRRPKSQKITLTSSPDWLARAERGDEGLVEEIVSQLAGQYQPEPPLKGLKIVL